MHQIKKSFCAKLVVGNLWAALAFEPLISPPTKQPNLFSQGHISAEAGGPRLGEITSHWWRLSPEERVRGRGRRWWWNHEQQSSKETGSLLGSSLSQSTAPNLTRSTSEQVEFCEDLSKHTIKDGWLMLDSVRSDVVNGTENCEIQNVFLSARGFPCFGLDSHCLHSLVCI